MVEQHISDGKTVPSAVFAEESAIGLEDVIVRAAAERRRHPGYAAFAAFDFDKRGERRGCDTQ